MKKLLVFLLAICCLLPVAACGGGGGDGGNTTDPPAQTGGVEWPDETDYSYVKSEKGTTNHAQNKTIDGNLSDWTEEEKANCIDLPVEDGHNMKVYAVKKDDGIYVAYDVEHLALMKSSRDPLINTNASFSFNDGVKRYVSIDDVSSGVTDYVFVSEKKEGENRRTVFEMFVAKEEIANFDGTVYGGFTWKDLEVKDYYWGFGGYWSLYDNSDDDASLLITDKGLLRPGNAHAENIVIDGDPSEDFWSDIGGIQSVETSYNYDGSFDMRAVLKEDGVYIAFTAEHNENADYPRYWCYNTNFEIKLSKANSYSHHIVSMYDQTIALSTVSIKEAEMITVYDEEADKYITLAEIFIPYESCVSGASMDSDDLYIGASFRADAASSQAVGAMIWTPLSYNGQSTWEMNVLRVTKDGLQA